MIVKQLDFTTVSPLLGWTQEGGRLEKWSRVNWEEDEEASLFFLPIFSTRLPVNFHDYFSAPTPLWRFWKKKLWYFRHTRNELNGASWWFCVAVKSQLIEILMMLVVEKPFLVLELNSVLFTTYIIPFK